jgi:hypothetical protein
MADQGPINIGSIDDVFSATPLGSIDRAIGNNLFGFNHRQVPGTVPSNRDQYGLTFFVRPQLNMQADNLRALRIMYPLLTSNPTSLQQFVKTTLDPRLMVGYQFGRRATPEIKCPMVDPLNAFIPVLTNNLKSMSGWPDIVVPTFSSKAGLYNEAYSMVDGVTRNFEEFDIDATFRNTRGDPIIYMMSIWTHYMAAVHEGRMVPYLDMISENEIDYNTRIYRLVLDQNRNIVTKIAACGVGYPISVPTGSFFDFNEDRPFNDQNKDISVRFKCLGVDYFDDILISEFNQTVAIFNSGMADANRNGEMVQVSRRLLPYFNNRGYPRINPYDHALEWYVSQALLDSRTAALLNANLLDQDTYQNEVNIGSGD